MKRSATGVVGAPHSGQSRRWLWFILSAAAILRFWGIWYGLPFGYHKDEYHEVMRALALGAGDFDFGRTSKGGFYFILFFEYGLYFAFLKLSGLVASAQEFAQSIVRDPTVLYLLGRGTAAVAGSATVAFAYVTTARAYTRSAGVIAALFLAANVLHVGLSRVIGVDVPMTLLAAITLYFGVRIAQSGERKDYLLAALFASLATTTKLTGVILLVPMLIAHAYSVWRSRTGIGGLVGKRELWLSALIFVAVLAVTNPGAFGSSGYISNFSADTQSTDELDEIDEMPELGGEGRPDLFAYYVSVMGESMGWPLFAVSLLGVLYALARRTPADVMLLSFGALNYLAIAGTSTELYYPRYALPVILVLAILAGRAVADLVQRAGNHSNALLVLTCVTCLVVPLWRNAAMAYALSEIDTRTQALDWFKQNVPEGSRVLIEGGKVGPERNSVPLPETPASLQRQFAYWNHVEPRQAQLLKFKLRDHPGGGYELVFLKMEHPGTLDDYVSQGVEYYVVRPTRFLQSRRAGTGTVQLVNDLRNDPRIQLVKTFRGETTAQLGPTIEIYRVATRAHGGRGLSR